MGFKFHTIDDGRNPAIEYIPAGAITPKVGMALKQVNGLLAAASDADKPAYLAMCQRETPCTEGELIPVCRVQPDMILGVPASVDMSAVALGSKVCIDADGTSVNADNGGACEVVAICEDDIVLVRIQ